MLALGRQAAVGAGRRSQQGVIINGGRTAAAAALQYQYGGLRQLSYEIKKVRAPSLDRFNRSQHHRINPPNFN